MKTIHFFTALTFIIAFNINNISAQLTAKGDYITRPVQFCFVPPLSTNLTYGSKIVNHFSLNVLVGSSAGTDGLEIGGLLNFDKANVKGVQIAGLGNKNGGLTNGVQVSGLYNINNGYVYGLQVCGLLNYVNDSALGIQIAGLSNINAKNITGFQCSALYNQAGGYSTGMQLTGLFNNTNYIEGVQVAGIMNRANYVKGVQLAGLINICDSIDGVPISLINIVRSNGYRKFEVSANEFFYLNAAYKMGVKKLYSIFALGYKPGVSNSWGFGYGFGTIFDLQKSSSLCLEIMGYHINEKRFWTNKTNELYQVKTNFEMPVQQGISIFAGPTFNVMVSKYNNNTKYDVVPSWSTNIWNKKNSVEAWFGFNAGIRF